MTRKISWCIRSASIKKGNVRQQGNVHCTMLHGHGGGMDYRKARGGYPRPVGRSVWSARAQAIITRRRKSGIKRQLYVRSVLRDTFGGTSGACFGVGWLVGSAKPPPRDPPAAPLFARSSCQTPTQTKNMATPLRVLLALACLCGAADAFVVSSQASSKFMAATTSPTAAAVSSLPRVPTVLLSESEAVNPLAWAVCAGGSAGIVFAAYCTSTGSPPTGLAVASATILFMVLAASTLDE